MSENLALFLLEQFTVATSKSRRSGTFADNMKLPVHRWFKYSAGFSAEWVKDVLKTGFTDLSISVFDPFSGSGTTLLAADELGVSSIGLDAHPFVSRIAKAKLLSRTSVDEFELRATDVLNRALSTTGSTQDFPKLIEKCYSHENLTELSKLREAWLITKDDSSASELVWLAITSILRPSSSAGTAQWQYILPNKTKKTVTRPFDAYTAQVELMSTDMRTIQNQSRVSHAVMLQGDARDCPEIGSQSIDIVITSPPYANNYDYADATRFEMSFWGEVQSWGDLHEAARKYLITSSAQHASKDKLDLESILDADLVEPIRGELAHVCHTLERERLLHGGKKHYHTMIAAYFLDMSKVWRELRRVCKPHSKICFIVGDSAPYGVYVPVEQWLGRLAVAAGFDSFQFEKLRDRNVKWKNRKHRVPLHEGRLWVQG